MIVWVRCELLSGLRVVDRIERLSRVEFARLVESWK